MNSGNRPFSTCYRAVPGVDPQLPGIAVDAAAILGGLWTPDQTWTNLRDSLASLRMIRGTYSDSDIATGYTITYQIGAIPQPESVALLGLGLGLMAARRRGDKAATAA